MNLPIRMIIAGLLLTPLTLVDTAAAAESVDSKPNVVIMIADDVSWNDFGCYGNPAARTPHIDALASQGLRFTEAFLTASSCSPSRASIITGRYPHNLGRAAELHEPIAANLAWFPTVLRQSGYYTALVGKNHMTPEPPAAGQSKPAKPWDLVDPGVTPDNHGAEARWTATIKNRPKDKPFFCWFASLDAHRNWDADNEWVEQKYGPKHQPEDVIVPPFLADEPATRQDLASYYNEVTRFDYFVGEVTQTLASEGELDNTLILVLADNGRPFPRAKTRLHDSGMKTALVAHWPKGIAGEGVTTSSLVSVIDIAPTVIEMAGAEIPETIQGVSMTPIFGDPQSTIRRFAFSEHNWHDYEAHGRSVRDGQFLYIRNSRPELAWQGPADSVRSPSHQTLRRLRDGEKLSDAQADVFLEPRPVEELYKTEDDPNQLNNLAFDPEYKQVKSRLSKVLDQWTDETGDAVPEELTPDYFDRETGDSLKLGKGQKRKRGTPPGGPKDAIHIHRPGPR